MSTKKELMHLLSGPQSESEAVKSQPAQPSGPREHNISHEELTSDDRLCAQPTCGRFQQFVGDVIVNYED
jgi:hypothetical protein